MKSWWLITMGVCSLAGCGHGANIPEATAPSSAAVATAHGTTPGKLEPKALPAPQGSDSLRANELSAPGTDDRFAVTRQVTALERSIELYQTFIERAGDDPRFEEAVRRSHARIDDARITICFLLEKPCDVDGDR